MKKIASLVGGLACISLVFTACGKGPVSSLSGTPTTNSSVTLSTESSPAGQILTDGQGHTLYDFVPDTPTESHCVSTTCVFLWPPLVVNGPVTVGKGLTQSLVATIKRPDGSTQVTYGGHPLYTYNSDVKPGMVLGQAISQAGGLWYVISPTGQQITTGFSVAS